MTMPMPSLPTDNLYKFLALGGLALLLVCFYAVLRVGETRERENAEWKYHTALLHAEGVADSLKDARLIDRVKKILRTEDQLDSEASKTGKTKEVYALSVRSDSLEEAINKISDGARWALDSEERGRAQIERDMALKYLPERYDGIERVARAGSFVGVLIMTAGFAGWYFKVQKYHDALLRRTAADGSAPVDNQI